MEGETSSAGEDDWTPTTIHSVKQKIHSTRSTNDNGPEFFTVTALVNNRPIKFIIDSGSPVSLMSKSQFNKITPFRPLEAEYRDVIDNRIRCEGKTTANVEVNGTRKELELLKTTKNTNPLLGLDWMEKLWITLETGKTVPQKHQIKEDPDITKLKTKFTKLFNENHTVNGLEVKLQLEEDAKLIQQKGSHTDTLTTIGGKRNRKVQ